MQIDRILYPVTTLGPGQRVAIWTVGCSKHCFHCANPELWDPDPAREQPAEEIASLILERLKDCRPDGITVTGGDPMEQPEELLTLLRALRPLTEDILVYTGYTLEELEHTLPVSLMDGFRETVGVLIDGRYVEELNDGKSPLTGSTNQTLHYFRPQLRETYAAYMAGGRKIQNFYSGGRLISVGIHNPHPSGPKS